ncbi:uncharacterized protein LOC110890206 isoform X1 [Helianthus annuus]|uniref:uncharacterized protein LOC110890206 isoform X1 n=1 Tax=Helianthus annuus TaxID=4232 RepID=UPI000B8F9E8B|nr:uncharacterized protein LOC110890206 isoform X1 [Helianthus annuus]XP_035836156.1 uncharacterized protein LOC110890206 isoform X1 [Helianthus annuus]XP_035836157.1 uncharacterized protein LOC110890206 isoform X1 [Helianthus annuus]XP_035836158.1 uncharacterized protein LOC110890206 isoform X1 [Helianthus annuus]XP_035836159.1 uncharacterized protein LOC110890206 isoform X1 [Helianthus annuus]
MANHMSFGGPPVKSETAEEADELMRVDEKASEVEVLSAPPKLVYSKLILRFTRKLLVAVADKWDSHVLVMDKVAPQNWKWFGACICKAAMHRLERGVWTSVRVGEIRRALFGETVITTRIYTGTTGSLHQIHLKNLDQIAQMLKAAHACIYHNEESKRPNMDAILSILKGVEANPRLRKTPAATPLSSYNYATEGYPQIQQTQNELNSHLALAMLGITEFEDDHDHLYF